MAGPHDGSAIPRYRPSAGVAAAFCAST